MNLLVAGEVLGKLERGVEHLDDIRVTAAVALVDGRQQELLHAIYLPRLHARPVALEQEAERVAQVAGIRDLGACRWALRRACRRSDERLVGTAAGGCLHGGSWAPEVELLPQRADERIAALVGENLTAPAQRVEAEHSVERDTGGEHIGLSDVAQHAADFLTQ